MEKINNSKAARDIKVCDFSTLHHLQTWKEKRANSKGLQKRNEPVYQSQQEGCTLEQCRYGWTFSKDKYFSRFSRLSDRQLLLYIWKSEYPCMTYGSRPHTADGESIFILLRNCIYGNNHQAKLQKCQFNSTSHFIDDPGMLNKRILVKEMEKIYPAKLVLDVENQDNNHAISVDIKVDVKEKIRKRIRKENVTSLRLPSFQICQEMYHLERHIEYIGHK